MARPKAGETFDHERLRALANDGLSIIQIAEAMGVTTRTVSRQKRAIGISRPKPESRPLEEWAPKAARLFDEGYSQQSVAELTGVCCQTVSRHFPGRGWTRHQTGQYVTEVRRLNQLPSFPQAEHRNHHTQECK
jgi:IS30 family transposase